MMKFRMMVWPGIGLGWLGCLLLSCTGDSTPSTVDKSVVKKPQSQSVETGKPMARKVVKPAVQPGQITGVTMGQLFTMNQAGRAYVVDCRPPIFYRLGHIDGAVNLPLKRYTEALPKQRSGLDAAVKAGKVIVLYCQNVDCPDAYALAKKLTPLGYSVSIYKGGWEEWRRVGL